MKNDITYEYRVFTNRLIDVESMEVGKCTSKVIKELKQKDKVDGRFFHTSDTDEWFFCWNGKLQKLNLKGNSDVNAALAEVRELIKKAETSVDNVNKIAQEAKTAAADAKTAADAATAAAGKIEDKADKSDVEDVLKVVEEKADKSVVDELSTKVDAIKVPSLEGYATKSYVDGKVDGKFDVTGSANKALADAKADAAEKYQIKGDYITKEELSGKGYATTEQVDTKQDSISDLDIIRSGAALGATALQSVPDEYVTEIELEDKGYLTKDSADLLYAPIGTTGSGESIDLSEYAKIEYVDNNFDASGSAAAALSAAKEYADGLVKDEEGNVLFEYTGAAETAEKNAKDYADSLATNYDAAGSAKQALDAAKEDAASLYQVKGDYLTEHQDISGKQDVIEDLDEIRANANLAKTALQEIPEEYVTEEELAAKGYLTSVNIDGKQDVISDLEEIRSNAKNALKSVPEEYITETELEGKGYLTEHQSLDNYYTKEQIDAMIKEINDMIGVAIEKTNTILA